MKNFRVELDITTEGNMSESELSEEVLSLVASNDEMSVDLITVDEG